VNIFKLQNEVWKIAEEKGWHEGEEISFGDFLALCHGELSEALEVYRVRGKAGITESGFVKEGNWKPVGIPIELADLIMRVLDYGETHGIDIENAIETKIEFNKTRPHRHGGKVL
jgi:NTP pyrophosphatase (non-canonical NTP hydrolase)